MGFNDISNIGLHFGLGLSLGLQDHHHKQRESHKIREGDDPLKCNKVCPSLTLGPSDHGDDDDEANNQQVSKIEGSCRSAVSSFSNSCNQFSGEEFEVEVEKVASKAVDNNDDGKPRKKLRLTREQSSVLEENFKEHSTLNTKRKQELARNLNLKARQVEVWFQNRRARTKLKQTESDCETLKKYCETLTEENKRLQKELEELRSIMQTTPGPFYMQIPAATFTICPSCERICDGNSNGSSLPSTKLLIGSKTHNHLYEKKLNINSATHHPQRAS